MDIEEAIRNPTIGNIGIAGLSVGLDLFGYSLLKGAYKTYKATRALSKAKKAYTAGTGSRAALTAAEQEATRVLGKTGIGQLDAAINTAQQSLDYNENQEKDDAPFNIVEVVNNIEDRIKHPLNYINIQK